MISFLPPARPSTPVAVYLKVLPGEARQSIQAFNWLGIPKLYIGAPSTTMSAARSSSSTTLVSANSACVDASTLAPPYTAAATISTMWPASAPYRVRSGCHPTNSKRSTNQSINTRMRLLMWRLDG
jgi:hypothetical protein